ncbi:MAG: hypothetical protein QNL12_00115 [Acidimicrobiia bacterium]|nr:hypothetical protein [Acidimicrobiia bacterium]MDX2465689.1 hypothetical protein [Acidimicrobiia bacterium]
MTTDRHGSRTRALVPVTVVCTLLLSGCGGAMSLTEYVDRINAVERRASQQAQTIAAGAEEITDLTPQDVQTGLELAHSIRIEVKESTDDIEPPEQVAELHELIFDWHTRFIDVEQALATRAGTAEDTAADWEVLSASPEMAAYRGAIVEGKEVCNEFQAQLDLTAERGDFADVPWLPTQLKEVVVAVLGCDWFPERPEEIYLYPPPG